VKVKVKVKVEGSKTALYLNPNLASTISCRFSIALLAAL